jgi:hypothetical protein
VELAEMGSYQFAEASVVSHGDLLQNRYFHTIHVAPMPWKAVSFVYYYDESDESDAGSPLEGM